MCIEMILIWNLVSMYVNVLLYRSRKVIKRKQIEALAELSNMFCLQPFEAHSVLMIILRSS